MGIKYRSAGRSRLRRPNFGPILRAPPSSIPVGQSKGKPFYGQVKGQLCPTWQSYAGLPPVEGAYVTGLASRPSGHSERSEESWYAAHMRQWALNTGQREAAAFDGSPPIPLRGTSPRESVSRDFQVAIAPLQITFACHPRPGGRINCPTLTCIFIWHYGLAAAGSIYTHRPAGRYLHPLNLLNPLHLLNPFL